MSQPLAAHGGSAVLSDGGSRLGLVGMVEAGSRCCVSETVASVGIPNGTSALGNVPGR